MPIIFDAGFGGGGGGGLRLRRPVDVFTGADTATAEAARDTYFETTNPSALSEFTADPSLAVLIRVTGESDVFQTFIGEDGDTYDSDNWVDRTDAVIGQTGTAGSSGRDGARGSLWTQSSDVPTDAIFQTLSGVAPQRGDHHLRTTTDRVYTRGATANAWNIGANLTGGRGTPGTDGTDGTDGEDGSDGIGVYASFSVNGSTSWHETPANDDKYIRFVSGATRPAEDAASWGVAIKFVGEDGADGTGMGGGGSDGSSVYIAFSADGSTGWQATPPAGVNYIRFATGTTRPGVASTDWGTAIQFVGDDGEDGSDGTNGSDGSDGTDGTNGSDGASVEIEFSANGTDWHANVASADTQIRFRVGTSGTWQSKRFVGRDGGVGARGSRWFVTTETTPQTQTGELQGDFQVVNDGEASVYMRGATAWADTSLNLRGPMGAGGEGGGAFTGDASDIDADLDNDPPQGGTVKAWLEWLAGENAIGETARTQLRTRIDALEHSAVRAAVDDWNDVTDHLAEYGNSGLLIATSDWTTVDAAATIWQSSPTVQVSGTYRVLAQLPAEFGIDRFRVQWDITGNGAYNFAIPNVQNEWAEFTGTVENGDPNAKYYILVDRATGNTQYRAVVPQNGSLNLQHNDGTPASEGLPPVVTANPSGSDGNDLERISIGGTNYNIPSGGGGNGGGTTETVEITVGSATDAAGTTLLNEETINAPLGETFVWRATRVDRNAYRIIRMPATTNTLVSVIGEGGEGIEGWSKQSDNLTWSTGPVANNARDPETFTVRVT